MGLRSQCRAHLRPPVPRVLVVLSVGPKEFPSIKQVHFPPETIFGDNATLSSHCKDWKMLVWGRLVKYNGTVICGWRVGQLLLWSWSGWIYFMPEFMWSSRGLAGAHGEKKNNKCWPESLAGGGGAGGWVGGNLVGQKLKEGRALN